jgi:hypothetical protein
VCRTLLGALVPRTMVEPEVPEMTRAACLQVLVAFAEKAELTVEFELQAAHADGLQELVAAMEAEQARLASQKAKWQALLAAEAGAVPWPAAAVQPEVTEELPEVRPEVAAELPPKVAQELPEGLPEVAVKLPVVTQLVPDPPPEVAHFFIGDPCEGADIYDMYSFEAAEKLHEKSPEAAELPEVLPEVALVLPEVPEKRPMVTRPGHPAGWLQGFGVNHKPCVVLSPEGAEEPPEVLPEFAEKLPEVAKWPPEVTALPPEVTGMPTGVLPGAAAEEPPEVAVELPEADEVKFVPGHPAGWLQGLGVNHKPCAACWPEVVAEKPPDVLPEVAAVSTPEVAEVKFVPGHPARWLQGLGVNHKPFEALSPEVAGKPPDVLPEAAEKLPEVAKWPPEVAEKLPKVSPEVAVELPEVAEVKFVPGHPAGWLQGLGVNHKPCVALSPEVAEKRPDLLPEFAEKPPEGAKWPPEVAEKLPEMLPEVAAESPPEVDEVKFVPGHPAGWLQGLGVNHKPHAALSPEVAEKPPDVLPEVAEKLPEVAQWPPEVAEELPEVSPEVAVQLPEGTQLLPEVAEKLPEVSPVVAVEPPVGSKKQKKKQKKVLRAAAARAALEPPHSWSAGRRVLVGCSLGVLLAGCFLVPRSPVVGGPARFEQVFEEMWVDECRAHCVDWVSQLAEADEVFVV